MSQDVAMWGVRGIAGRHSFKALALQAGEITLERGLLHDRHKLLHMVVNIPAQLFQQGRGGTPDATRKHTAFRLQMQVIASSKAASSTQGDISGKMILVGAQPTNPVGRVYGC